MADDDEYLPLTGIELADAVEAVREGLIAGTARGAGKVVRFEVGEIHMEFAVELRRTRTARGGVKAWVVDTGGDAARTTGRTHTGGDWDRLRLLPRLDSLALEAAVPPRASIQPFRRCRASAS